MDALARINATNERWRQLEGSYEYTNQVAERVLDFIEDDEPTVILMAPDVLLRIENDRGSRPTTAFGIPIEYSPELKEDEIVVR